MSDINKCIISGNLGAEPELRFSQGGTAILSLRLCSSASYLDKDKQRKERQAWVNVKIFGPRAEPLSKILGKGQRVVVEGAIETGSYEDKSGQKRQTFEIVCQEIVLAGGKRDAAPREDDGYAPQGRSEGGGYSRGGGGNGGGAARAPQDIVESPPDGATFGNDDDIPFTHTVGCGPWRV